MNKGRRGNRAFTLIEAIVAVSLVAVGVVGVIGALAHITKMQTEANSAESMQRLAYEKFDELVGTGSVETQSLNGDFSDQGDDSHLWDATVETTATENLSSLTVSVQPRNGDENSKVTVTGLVYIAPQTTTTGPTGATGTGGGQ